MPLRSEPEEDQTSALSQTPELDSLLNRSFDTDNTSNISSLHDDGEALGDAQPDFSGSEHDRLSSQQTESRPELRTLTSWNPFWSSPTLLVTVSSLLTLLSAATIVLWRVSVGNHGFPLLTTNNYSWTYGPTAVLTVIMSIWNQTTYCCKLLEPWKELKRGPASPERTVLLDYISPILPVNLWKAARFKHATVAIAIYAGIMLRIVTVASTGLLSPVSMSMPYQNVTLEALTTFNASNYKSGESYFDSLAESAIDYEAYALIADDLPFPDGLQPNLAFQRFKLPDNSTANRTLSTVRGTVQSFRPLIQCQEASLVPLNATTSPYDNVDVIEIFANASWESCSWSQSHPKEVDITFKYLRNMHPTRQLFSGVPFGDYTCRDAKESFWSLVTLFDIRYNQTAIPSAILQAEPSNSSDTWGIQIMEVTSVACSISYSMVPAQVTYDLSRNPPEPTILLPSDTDTGHPGPFVEGFTESDFSNRLNLDADNADFIVGSYITKGTDEFVPDTFVNMMSLVADTSATDFLGNPGTMSSAATTVFTYTGVQVANRFLLSNTTQILQGEISTTSMRLQISALASLAMVSGFLLVAVGAMALVLIRAQDVVTHKIGPIGNMAMILRDSPDFNNLLKDCGQKRTEQIEKTLEPFTFQSMIVSTKPGFCSIIPGLEHTANARPTELPPEESITWWRPIPLRPWIFALISAFPLAIIATLEILQHLSSRVNGMTSIASPDSMLVTFGTRFVPSVLFMTVAMLYDSIEFNVLVLAPFARLKKAQAKGKPVITHALLGRFSIESFGFSLRNKYWETAFATLAAFLGSFLTIAASGLYTIESLPGPSPVTVRRVDRFDPTWPDSVSDDGGAAVLVTDMEVLNLSFPSWTNSELTFPEIQLPSKDLSRIKAMSEPSITVRVPAIRGELQCSTTPTDDISVYVPYAGESEASLIINATTSVPTTCDQQASTIDWSSRQLLSFNSGKSGLVGQMLDLHAGDRNLRFGEFSLPLQNNSAPGCPSLAFTFGNYSLNTSDILNITLNAPPAWFTTMSCFQLMAEIQTEVTLSIPNFTVISAVPDESTIRYLPSGPSGQTAFPWRPQLHFELEVIVWDGNVTYGGFGSPSVVQNYDNPNYNVDGFFTLMLQPSSGVYPENIRGPENQGKLVDAIQGLYQRYMAQVANAKMRVPVAIGTTPETYTATWINSDRGVLRQNWRSKLELQILLTVMFICGISSYLIIDTKEVLPHDPCSIAGLASLLAGSSMCDEATGSGGSEGGILDGSSWHSRLFGLGWWWSPEGGGERFGIDVKDAQWKLRKAGAGQAKSQM
ncbi:hypothetical protein J7T55_000340 [Diaporthe amygdali]|uniref:uncharacterized protein n=1 Tax=Phomopsis amygdali TaxID=1214568 RepID=UPI0022FE8663|nr:uncharacterized protein J7T55_000340 [Diaporthe amygdali]KAJ0109415.1 hypothetical protein J7T55_000340 [Diaporthe amygdali]